MTRWTPDDLDSHMRKQMAWKAAEARRADEAKRRQETLERNITAIGQYASGVDGAVLANRTVTSGGVESRHASPTQASSRKRANEAQLFGGTHQPIPPREREAGVAPGPLTHPQADSRTDTPQGRRPAAATGTPKESAILKLVGLALELHPRMAWHARMNSGAMTVGQRFVRFAFKGCSDFIGQTTDGLFVAIEVKRPGGRLTEDQIGFLGKVSRAGGVAFVARSAEDVAKGLG